MPNGNAKITEALKDADKKDRLRLDVSGDLEGDTGESYINQTALISGSPRRCVPGNSLPAQTSRATHLLHLHLHAGGKPCLPPKSN
jgi:hypothetical protein